MNDSFRRGAREGLQAFLPMSVGLVPWAMVTGVAMRPAGFSVFGSMGMNLIVFAGTAQRGTLPLIGSGFAAAPTVVVAGRWRNPWLPFIAGMAVLLVLRRGLGW